jgi:hypothetical protein
MVMKLSCQPADVRVADLGRPSTPRDRVRLPVSIPPLERSKDEERLLGREEQDGRLLPLQKHLAEAHPWAPRVGGPRDRFTLAEGTTT